MKTLNVKGRSKIVINDDNTLTLVGTNAHNLYFRIMNKFRFDDAELTQEELSELTKNKIIEVIERGV